MATLNTLLAPDLIKPGTQWTLLSNVNGYGRPTGDNLTTQGRHGRSIRLLERRGDRLLVQLLNFCFFKISIFPFRTKLVCGWIESGILLFVRGHLIRRIIVSHRSVHRLLCVHLDVLILLGELPSLDKLILHPRLAHGRDENTTTPSTFLVYLKDQIRVKY